MRNIPVCTDKWNGRIKEQFEWLNNDPKNDAEITKIGSGWPFTLPSPIKVPAGGTKACGLKDQPGTYNYDANPCKTEGNPKTVIIG